MHDMNISVFQNILLAHFNDNNFFCNNKIKTTIIFFYNFVNHNFYYDKKNCQKKNLSMLDGN